MYSGYGFNEEKKASAVIDLAAIEHNCRFFQARLKDDCNLCAVVKADAYGHGACEVAKRLAGIGVTHFAVAHVDEGILLRKAGIKGMILVLGMTIPECFRLLSEYDISQSCASLEYLRALNLYTESTGKTVKIHLKLNTGMNRTGFVTDGELTGDLRLATEILKKSPLIERQGIFTHFARSDEPESGFTEIQAKRYLKCTDALEAMGAHFEIHHICNSSGILNSPEYHLDMVRLGIGLYGYCTPQPKELLPAMTFRASVVAVNKLHSGDGVSYGLTFKAEKNMTVAVVCAGYADGVHRSLSSKGAFLCHGVKCGILGRVCMDMTMIDVTEIADKVKIGDTAVLFGRDGNHSVGADEVAEKAGTISYELLCAVGDRYKRVYNGRCITSDGKPQ